MHRRDSEKYQKRVLTQKRNGPSYIIQKHPKVYSVPPRCQHLDPDESHGDEYRGLVMARFAEKHEVFAHLMREGPTCAAISRARFSVGRSESARLRGGVNDYFIFGGSSLLKGQSMYQSCPAARPQYFGDW
jgi:hypothetical protein